MANAFDQLASFKQTLTQQAAQQAIEKQKIAAEQARISKEAHLFKDAVGAVQALKVSQRVQSSPIAPQPIARQRDLDNRQVMIDSLSDHFGVEQLLETDSDLSYRALGIGTDVLNKLRRGEWAVQAQLDLHGHRVEEARIETNAFVQQASDRGLRCVRIVHGKGLGSKDKQPVLKSRVRSWLIQKKEVLAFVAARPSEGGHGALIVLLTGH